MRTSVPVYARQPEIRATGPIRKFVLMRVIAALTAFVLALFAYATGIERRWLSITRYCVRVTELPDAWEGTRIVQLSDLHLGAPGTPYGMQMRAVKAVLALRPDLIVFTGDFSDDGRLYPMQFLAPLVQAAPTFAILGNHDYFSSFDDTEAIVATLTALGITMVRNTVAPWTHRGETVLVVGIDDRRPDIAAVRTALGDEHPFIVLLHRPDFAQYLPSHWVPLVVAGHTHGAQVRLSPVRQVDWVNFVHGDKHTRYPRGWFTVRGNRLYVNRGLGVAGYPIRFAARPEISCFTLTRDQGNRYAGFR